MSIENTLESVAKLNEDKYLQNQVAQLNARYILLNTDEEKQNFPNYSVKDEEMTLLAFHYLNLGCRLAEQQAILEASQPLERGAQILEYIYGSKNNETNFRNYHVLISGLAYYSAFQYSKSFILIKKAENETTIAKLLNMFLSRRFNELQNDINTIIINKDYINLNRSDHEDETSSRIYEIVIARSLSKVISYLNFGNQTLLEQAKEELETLKDIASLKEDVDVWWTIRLILIILGGVERASLWSVLIHHYKELPPLVSNFIFSHVFAKRTKVHEFFTTQRSALEKVINKDDGVVISMPTSSGKTRIAEVAILDTKVKDTNSKILFIAPYKSLAFEIENDLGRIFTPIGITVSQLYGGSLFSKIDEKLIQDTDVIIATQEKAKALFRSDNELIKTIKLVVLDEGHLLGGGERDTRNELFMEELRFHIHKKGGKFIVLSAVLPNPEDLSFWLTESDDNVFDSDWRPSEERMGILEWTGKSVNLNWLSADDERNSFNNRFVIAEKQPRKPRERTDKYIPGDKNEAVAATAIKLFKFGPVLIYVGLKASVFTMARAYKKVLANDTPFPWKNQNNWQAFELACIEFDGDDSIWLHYARLGILCHNANLPSDVRIPLERLMRTERPRVIIATSTLGQGVNLGVSSIIFATLQKAAEKLSYSDFWNIAGRAGRAFVDQEGKILVALDNSKRRTLRERHKVTRTQRSIEKYFNKSNLQNAKSGLLWSIRTIKYSSAFSEGVSFERLLELVAENDFSELEHSDAFINELDIIDDTLLALHQLNHNEIDPTDVVWVEEFFKKSLAYLQCAKDEEDTFIKEEQIITFIKARIGGILKAVGQDSKDWDAHIRSGIPLQSDLILEASLQEIIELIDEFFLEEDYSIGAKTGLLSFIESIVNQTPVLQEEYLQNERLKEIRELWLAGNSMTEIKAIQNASVVVNQHYSFKLPWVLNGIAKKLQALELESHSQLLQELSILSETGLPNLVAVKVYQAGIRSRQVAIEVASMYDDDSWDKGISYYKYDIIKNADFYKLLLSDDTAKWIDLFLQYNEREHIVINEIPPFYSEHLLGLGNVILFPKTINKEHHLVSSDLTVIVPVKSVEGLYLAEVIDKEGVYFIQTEDGYWQLNVANPNIEINRIEEEEF
ncbi:helicase [Flavobacterium arcticum]|uniref:Helicase n=1 Tax=Flavobacterium arcticum TaxID=1784713 RepID=A0A345H8Q9_9FLAO|nr:DEAD/DEAH box helicase [Flavobacterium arcticum]AXG72969.1 helicase [Flavobacterium arcticum]KAF2510367.1 DEAD/DEAH box helicase [Flavobacterium arcticum]